MTLYSLFTILVTVDVIALNLILLCVIIDVVTNIDTFKIVITLYATVVVITLAATLLKFIV